MDADKGQTLHVTSQLKSWEKISVAFLLCKSSSSGLNIMEKLLSSSEDENQAFSQWVWEEGFLKNNRCGSFLEAMAIIQNYKIGNLLGYKKEDLQARFLPSKMSKTVELCNVRKILFNLCEYLILSDMRTLVEKIEKKFNLHSSEVPQYLEFELLLWDKLQIIQMFDRKGMALGALLDHLDVSTGVFSNELRLAVDTETSTSNDFYDIINEKEPGLCVIINEKFFHESEVAELQPLVPKVALQSRVGTEVDVMKLQSVFGSFGFQVHVHNDVTYKQLLFIIDNYRQLIKKTHSFFVFVVLSHGSENVVYTCDSIPISVDTIELAFQGRNCPNMIGKPKIFIIQSCQGEEWQQIQTDTCTVQVEPMLGAGMNIGPERGDSVIAWSTVKGYASFRDRQSGSWFIQELCDALLENADTKDFVDICTSVNNALRGKTHQGQFMVPWLSLSICKKIKFPKQIK